MRSRNVFYLLFLGLTSTDAWVTSSQIARLARKNGNWQDVACRTLVKFNWILGYSHWTMSIRLSIEKNKSVSPHQFPLSALHSGYEYHFPGWNHEKPTSTTLWMPLSSSRSYRHTHSLQWCAMTTKPLKLQVPQSKWRRRRIPLPM